MIPVDINTGTFSMIYGSRDSELMYSKWYPSSITINQNNVLIASHAKDIITSCESGFNGLLTWNLVEQYIFTGFSK